MSKLKTSRALRAGVTAYFIFAALFAACAGAEEAVPKPPEIRLKKIKRKPAQEAGPPGGIRKQFANSAFTGASITLRFANSPRGYGRFQDILVLPIEGQFSFYLNNSFSSSRPASRSDLDMADWGSGLYLFSPNVGGFGAVALYSDQSGGRNNSIRGGLYHRFFFSGSRATGLFITKVFPVPEHTDSGRLKTLWSMNFFKYLNFSGASTTVFSKPKTTAVRPILGIEIFKGFRIGMAYDFNDSLSKQRGVWEPTVEFCGFF